MLCFNRFALLILFRFAFVFVVIFCALIKLEAHAAIHSGLWLKCNSSSAAVAVVVYFVNCIFCFHICLKMYLSFLRGISESYQLFLCANQVEFVVGIG